MVVSCLVGDSLFLQRIIDTNTTRTAVARGTNKYIFPDRLLRLADQIDAAASDDLITED